MLDQPRFIFSIPATVTIAISADDEASAWQEIKGRTETQPQFVALPYHGDRTSDWFCCQPDYNQAELLKDDAEPVL